MLFNIPRVLASAAAVTIVIGSATTWAVETPVSLRGTIEHIDGNTINIKERGGGTATLRVANDAKIVSVAKASLADVKPGSYIGTAATPQPNGTLQALEVHIFPASMRGVGEGFRAWNLAPKSTMTNGTVAQVDKVAGDRLTVNYRGGQKVVTITPKTEVVALVPGDRNDLKADAKIFVPAARKSPDGTLEADRLTVGKNGLAPPM